jgi:multiple antibiotic resistance protein
VEFLWTDFYQWAGATLLVLGALVPVINPIGDAPMFLALTHGCDQPTREHLSNRIAVYSFLLLLGSLILGSVVLRLFGLSVPVVQVAGGAVVCALGWRLLNDDSSGDVQVDLDRAKSSAIARAFYPLTLPVTVDPGAISVAVTLGANHAHTVEKLTVQILAALSGALASALIILLTYRYAGRLGQWLGHTGMTVLIRLSAFIVLCIGVQIGYNGLKTLVPSLAPSESVMPVRPSPG